MKKLTSMVCYVLAFACLMGVTTTAFAQQKYGISMAPETKAPAEQTGWWAEIWNLSDYRKTNFGQDQQYYTEDDFYLSRTAIKGGYRFKLAENWYADPYVGVDMIMDFANESWNKYAWNNNQQLLVGARVRHEYKRGEAEADSFFYLDSLNFDVYTEMAFITDSILNSKDDLASNVPDNDYRLGIAFYFTTLSQKFASETCSLFAEGFFRWYYASTNFGVDDEDDFFILRFEPRMGLKYELSSQWSLQPYFHFDLVYDFGSKDWNKNEWLNNLQYGPGIRLSYNDCFGVEGSSIKLYCVYLKASYFDRVPEAQIETKADDDTRVGLEFWFPFGATKGSQAVI